ncbi:MAG: phosphoribosyltransferase family protein [Kiritimatiellota bacterium]|nr:phosphoribosyltransferase family protein [Kiritimatiellota bacterium]
MTRVRILSRSAQPFRDRQEAGELLAAELAELRGQNPVVLGIPRGGVAVAREIAASLDGDLDIILARKLRTPGQTELAMGSVSEHGEVFLNELVIRQLGIGSAEIEHEKTAQMEEIERRRRLLRSVAPKIPLRNRLVIITDDGVATGATMQVAVWAIKQEEPSRLVAALPVAADEAVHRLAGDVDEIVCLRMPLFFGAVGQFYIQFTQVEDSDVLSILKEARARAHRKPGTAERSHPAR